MWTVLRVRIPWVCLLVLRLRCLRGPTGSWVVFATMWMIPAGTMDMLASVATALVVLPLRVVVGLTPTDQASSTPEKDGTQAQVRPFTVGHTTRPGPTYPHVFSHHVGTIRLSHCSPCTHCTVLHVDTSSKSSRWHTICVDCVPECESLTALRVSSVSIELLGQQPC